MTDPKIEEIYALADAAFRQGLSSFQVHIFPFRMNGGNMERYSDSKWIDFWENLKEGYDSFERDRNPPSVSVRNKRYVFATESQ
jgi:murein L,D-transpeptidase YafK